MTMDQISYFFKHLLDSDVSHNMRLLNALVYMVIPEALGMLIIFVGMKIIRGNKKALKFLVGLLYIISIAFPVILGFHSLIFLRQYDQILSVIVLYMFWGFFFTIGIQEYYPRYSYKTDEDYFKAFPLLDGRHTIAEYPYPRRLKIYNILYGLSVVIIFIGGFICFSSSKDSISQQISFSIMALGMLCWMGSMVFTRRLVICPACQRYIYGFSNSDKSYKSYFLPTILHIFRYHCFTCKYCFAYIKVGKRDIIKEKNLEIINMHQPDFTVQKRK